MSRSQVSRQLVYLLQQTGVLGASTSAFESSLPIEGFLASGLTFPIAAVMTEDAETDPQNPWRFNTARFVISVAGSATTETVASNFVASGGSGSSQHTLEHTISALLTGMNSGLEGLFTATTHGFQGRVTGISMERLTLDAPGKTYVVAEIEIEVTDCLAAEFYTPPYSFTATAGASHTIALAWTNPATRFDQYQNVLRRGTNAGDAAPTTPSGGTGITITGGTLGTSATDTLAGAGLTYNYALFRTYTRATSGDQYSVAVTASATTT